MLLGRPHTVVVNVPYQRDAPPDPSEQTEAAPEPPRN
jgi:hypothetical protein